MRTARVGDGTLGGPVGGRSAQRTQRGLLPMRPETRGSICRSEELASQRRERLPSSLLLHLITRTQPAMALVRESRAAHASPVRDTGPLRCEAALPERRPAPCPRQTRLTGMAATVWAARVPFAAEKGICEAQGESEVHVASGSGQFSAWLACPSLVQARCSRRSR